jgi:hypothetical protein
MVKKKSEKNAIMEIITDITQNVLLNVLKQMLYAETEM